MKSVQTAEDINDDLLKERPIHEPRKPSWTSKYMPSLEQIASFTDPKFLIPNGLIEGHLSALCGEPGSAKTTIAMWMAAILAATHEVTYVNADISSCDVKYAWEFAQKHGFVLAMPDLIAGMSMDDVVNDLIALNNGSEDLSQQVIFLDTLKKCVDVIDKRAGKRLYSTLRGLTAKGATVVLLCHTNKYKDDEGNPIYEGTGDLKSDIDELIYLIPQKHDDGTMTVSTKPDKVRGIFKPITFEIDADRSVTIADEFIDVAARRALAEQRDHDQPVIERVTEAIQSDIHKQCDIYLFCKENGLGRNQVEPVLSRYEGRLWQVERQFKNNALHYYLT